MESFLYQAQSFHDVLDVASVVESCFLTIPERFEAVKNDFEQGIAVYYLYEHPQRIKQKEYTPKGYFRFFRHNHELFFDYSSHLTFTAFSYLAELQELLPQHDIFVKKNDLIQYYLGAHLMVEKKLSFRPFPQWSVLLKERYQPLLFYTLK